MTGKKCFALLDVKNTAEPAAYLASLEVVGSFRRAFALARSQHFPLIEGRYKTPCSVHALQGPESTEHS